MAALIEQQARCWADAGGWQALFAAIDRRDAAAFASFLTADGEFRFGNAPAVRGRPAVLQAVAGFFGTIVSCHHRMTASWQDASSAVCEGEVSYVVAGGATVTLPFVNVLDVTDAGISSYRIYIDNGPLFAALG